MLHNIFQHTKVIYDNKAYEYALRSRCSSLPSGKASEQATLKIAASSQGLFFQRLVFQYPQALGSTESTVNHECCTERRDTLVFRTFETVAVVSVQNHRRAQLPPEAVFIVPESRASPLKQEL